MTDTPKLCVECRHHVGINGTHWCRNPLANAVDLVTGKTRLVGCDGLRAVGGLCGPLGKLWEAKK